MKEEWNKGVHTYVYTAAVKGSLVKAIERQTDKLLVKTCELREKRRKMILLIYVLICLRTYPSTRGTLLNSSCTAAILASGVDGISNFAFFASFSSWFKEAFFARETERATLRAITAMRDIIRARKHQ